MENVNCKKFLLGAILVAFGSAQIISTDFPQNQQGPNMVNTDPSLPEPPVLGGQGLVGGQVPVQQNYQEDRTFESMPSSIGGNGVTVLDSQSQIVRGDVQSYETQHLNGYGYQTSNEIINPDPRVFEQQGQFPIAHLIELKDNPEVQPAVQQEAPVVQDAQQYGRPEVYGQQYASTFAPEQAQPNFNNGAVDINTGDQTNTLQNEVDQAGGNLRG